MAQEEMVLVLSKYFPCMGRSLGVDWCINKVLLLRELESVTFLLTSVGGLKQSNFIGAI